MAKLLEALGEKSLRNLERVNVMLYRGQLRWLDEFIAKYNARRRDENAAGTLYRRPPINRSHVLRVALMLLKEEHEADLDRHLRPVEFEFSRRVPATPRRTKITTPPPTVEELRAAGRLGSRARGASRRR